jgi:hypothetical protein
MFIVKKKSYSVSFQTVQVSAWDRNKKLNSNRDDFFGGTDDELGIS